MRRVNTTNAQLENYFKNVENGLVTRCSFTSIENQEFVLPPKWGEITKKKREAIRRFVERCDRRTYEEPCTVDPFELETVTDEEFDKKIDWKFKFREKQMVDLSWIMPTIEAFHEEQVKKSAFDIDRARDTFRRRVGVRGFRLALLCYGLYEQPRKADLENCAKFVNWWMHRDLESSLKLWAEKYNSLTDTHQDVPQRSVFDQLGEVFSREDVYVLVTKQYIKTPLRMIIYQWTKMGFIEKIDAKQFRKITSKQKKNNGSK